MSTRGEQIAALVLAAGRSTRFRSARSKLVHTLGGRSIIAWVLTSLRAAGASPIVAVVGPAGDDVRAVCGPDIRYAVQDEPRGTGDAVLAARSALRGFSGSVLMLYGDLPLLRAETLRHLIDAHRAAGGTLSLLTATVADSFGWGRIVRTAAGDITRIVEQRDATEEQRAIREVNVGVYCVSAPRLFEWLGRVTPHNAQREIYLTDIVSCAVADGVKVAHVDVDPIEVGQINSRGELAAMERTLRAQITAKWMAAGVTFEDPDTAYVGPDVTIGQDTVIGPNVQLRGHTHIGNGCRLDGSAYVVDSQVGDRTHLRFGVVITEAEIGEACEIGPFANLRPKTRLGNAVHIGDFVETKNARLGDRTKANHLAYLGDAEIGREVNVGAGTITCNYDGFRKHQTVIGDRVQVGSDTTLVAPVRLGDDAYVATATTVRNDVPAGGVLVFNPREQEERPGWVAKFRARQTGAKPSSVGKPARKAAKKPAVARVQRTSKAKKKRSR